MKFLGSIFLFLILQSCQSINTKDFVEHRQLAVTIRDTSDELLRDTLAVDSKAYSKKLKEELLKGKIELLKRFSANSLEGEMSPPSFIKAEKNILALYKLNNQFVKHADLLLKVASYDSKRTIEDRSLETSTALDDVYVELGKDGVGNKGALISGSASSLFKIYLQNQQRDSLSDAIRQNLPLIKEYSNKAKRLLPLIRAKQISAYDRRYTARVQETMRLIREIQTIQNPKDKREYDPIFEAMADSFVRDAKTYKLVTQKRYEILTKTYAKLPSSYEALRKSVIGETGFKAGIKVIVDEMKFAKGIYNLNEKSLEYRESVRIAGKLKKSKDRIDSQIQGKESRLRVIEIRLSSLNDDAEASQPLEAEKMALEKQLGRLRKISEHLDILESDAKTKSNSLKIELEETKKK